MMDKALGDFLKTVADWLAEHFEPIFSVLGRGFDFALSFREDSPILFWTLMGGLSLLFIAIVIRLAVLLTRAIKARRLERSFPDTLLSSKPVTPEQLEAEATQAGKEGDRSLALRLLFMAGIMRLEKASDNFYKPALTNAEYMRRFARTEAEKPLAFLAQALNRWYAGEPCDQAVYEKGVQAHKRLVALAREQS